MRLTLGVFLVLLLMRAFIDPTTQGGKELGDLFKDMLTGGEVCTVGEYSGKKLEFFNEEFPKYSDGQDWRTILKLYRGLNACFGVGATYSWIDDRGSPQSILDKSAQIHMSKPLSNTANVIEAQEYIDMAEQFEAAMAANVFVPYKKNLEDAREYLECRSEVMQMERGIAQGTPDALALSYVKYVKMEAKGCNNLVKDYGKVLENIHNKKDTLEDRQPYDDSVGSYLCQMQRTALTEEDQRIMNDLVRADVRADCR